MRCSFGVKTTGTSFADVRADNEKKTKRIADALAGLKIDGLAVRTAPMDVQMQPDPGPQPGQPPGPGGPPIGFPPGAGPGLGGPAGPPPGAAPKDGVSYTVTHSFSVEIKNADVDKLVAAADRVLAAAVSQGANAGAVAAGNNYYGPMGLGGGVSSGGTRLEFYRQDPNAERQQALKQAVAAALANAKAAAGGADVAVKEVVTLTDQPSTPFGLLGGGLGLPASPDITGETEVTVSVSVTCTY